MSLELFLTETARAGGIELLLAAGRPIVVRPERRGARGPQLDANDLDNSLSRKPA
ncbi:MAG: hypothetical protein ABR517_05425 [Thermoanaerobaculia bacterium]